MWREQWAALTEKNKEKALWQTEKSLEKENWKDDTPYFYPLGGRMIFASYAHLFYNNGCKSLNERINVVLFRYSSGKQGASL